MDAEKIRGAPWRRDIMGTGSERVFELRHDPPGRGWPRGLGANREAVPMSGGMDRTPML